MVRIKGPGHVTVNKPIISRIYIGSYMWPLCSAQILVDEVNPQKVTAKVHQCLCHRKHMRVLVVPLRSTRVHFQNNNFILRKVVENLHDMDYQKCCKIVVSKEFCLHYVICPFNGTKQTSQPRLTQFVTCISHFEFPNGR